MQEKLSALIARDEQAEPSRVNPLQLLNAIRHEKKSSVTIKGVRVVLAQFHALLLRRQADGFSFFASFSLFDLQRRKH
ncbi:UNVERIFIED_CONTAM: hypothetical protein Sradi_1507700 [Sesamum radiatum]|uniref:Uncharacterized protein n=1 Tax=Sesamum radiatum TaxID=300843 RepID=A0AAW2U7Z1_SESRA